MRYDLAIIGSGGAAYAAAIAARQRDLTVVMIEQGALGGTCVNTGCVPSKALLAAAEARHIPVSGGRFPGITAGPGAVDFGALVSGKTELVEAMRAEKYADLAEAYGWQVLSGSARFTGSAEAPALHVRSGDDTQQVEARHYLVATGSRPWAPPIDGLAEAGYATSTTVMELDRLPASMIVLGGNAIGLEMGQLFARLGTRVTVVEAQDRPAPYDEPEISRGLREVFADEGIPMHTGTTVTGVARDSEGYLLRSDQPVELRAEQLLVATGRRPVTAGLDLATVGVGTGSRDEVVVDEYLRTTNPRIWAAGDVTGHPQFVYVAGAHGTLMVHNAFENAGRTLEYHHLPAVTFTSPQVASAGLTDAEAVARGYACECRVLPLAFVPRALVDRDTRGLVKLVAERGTGRLLGAHMLAHGAGDVISTAVYALANRMTVHQMADLWAPYLTMSEGLKLAAQAFTRDVSLLSCCAS